MHRSRKHGYIDPIDSHIDTVHCPVCMLHFDNRIRVLNHIKYRSNICNIALKASGAVLTPEETIELNNSQRALRRTRYAAGLRAHAATVPVFRMPGPLPLPVIFTGSYGKIHILGNGRRHYS